jgi:multimeric flavodoxin WrbA
MIRAPLSAGERRDGYPTQAGGSVADESVVRGGPCVKVVAFNGSARKDGNTAVMVRKAFEPLEAAGVDTELVQLAGEPLRGCRACGTCHKRKDMRCVYDDDAANEHIGRMVLADAIILASPVYFSDVTAEMKALIERAGYVAMANDSLLRRKLGAGVVAVRRAGAMHTFDTLNHFFQISEMLVVGSTYWNIGIGRKKGEVADDVEGMETMEHLGENMAWALERLAAGA